MEAKELLKLFQAHTVVRKITRRLSERPGIKITLENGIGSIVSFVAASVEQEMKSLQLFVMNDKE